MQIVQRHNKYFLQFDSGELELSEQQVQKRLERGDKVLDQLNMMQENLPEIDSNIKIEKNIVQKNSVFAPQSYTSAKYFDHVLYEFEQIYKANIDDPETGDKLKRFCKNSIEKLENDRKSPRTDHVVIDYYILSWNRLLNFIDTLPEKIGRDQEAAKQNDKVKDQPPAPADIPQPEPPKTSLKDHTKQLLIIQLMQADGIFPINNAIDGVTQKDILRLISGVLSVEEQSIHQALHNATSILLKRNVTAQNIGGHIQLLEEVETFFEELPYPNIISRIKMLLKIYREKQAGS
jgi:hypothetical protein